LRRATLDSLISADWIEGEATEQGITVSAKEVQRRFRRLKHGQFGSERAFRRSLRKTGQTVDDILFRVRIDLLAAKLEARAVVGKSGPARQRALDEYVRTYQAKWKDRTYCLPAFTIDKCGHTLVT
jgi:hypothetical protein